MPKVKLTEKDVRHLATLSQLTLSDSEIKELLHKLEETVTYIENIGEVNTTGFEGAYHSTDNTNIYRADDVDATRQFDQKTALKNATQVKKEKFVVERILE